MKQNNKHDNKTSQFSAFWLKLKKFFSYFRSRPTYKDKELNRDEDESGDSGDSGQTGGSSGFVDPKTTSSTNYVKDPETRIYNELKNDPVAMAALKKLTNGQIPSSDVAIEFNKVRNSEIALETIANSEFAPSDVKAKAREELDKQRRRKLQAEPGFKKPPPKPPRF